MDLHSTLCQAVSINAESEITTDSAILLSLSITGFQPGELKFHHLKNLMACYLPTEWPRIPKKPLFHRYKSRTTFFFNCFLGSALSFPSH